MLMEVAEVVWFPDFRQLAIVAKTIAILLV